MPKVMKNDNNAETQTLKSNKELKSHFWMFFIPSMIGLFLFMAPITYNGDITIPIAILASALQGLLEANIVDIIALIIGLMAVASVATKIHTPAFIKNSGFLTGLLNPTPLWLAVRVIGGLAVVATYFQIGPMVVWEENTGGLVLEGSASNTIRSVYFCRIAPPSPT